MPTPYAEFAEILSDFIKENLEEIKKYVKSEIANAKLTSTNLLPGSVISPKIPDNAVVPRTVNIPLLFADQATINALKVATVGSIEAGTTVTINEDTFNINFDTDTGTFSISIGSAAEGSQVMSVNKDGGHFQNVTISGRLDCDIVAMRYSGDSEFLDQTSVVSILDALNYSYLDMDVTISLASGIGTFLEQIEFVGIHGPGHITFNGNENIAGAGVIIRDCLSHIAFTDLYGAYTEDGFCPNVTYTDCGTTGSFSGSLTASAVSDNARTFSKENSAWYPLDTVFIQGYTEYFFWPEVAGVMWFADMAAYSSETIQSATIRLKRYPNGVSKPTDVILYTADNTSASGALVNKTYYGKIGEISQNEVKTFSLPVAAAEKVCAGGCLVIDSGETEPIPGGWYSENASQFYGTNSSMRPLMSIVYEGGSSSSEFSLTRDYSGMAERLNLAATSTQTPATTPSLGTVDIFRLDKVGNHVDFVMRYTTTITTGANTETGIIPTDYLPVAEYVALSTYYGNASPPIIQSYVSSTGNIMVRTTGDISNVLISGSWITA